MAGISKLTLVVGWLGWLALFLWQAPKHGWYVGPVSVAMFMMPIAVGAWRVAEWGRWQRIERECRRNRET